MKYLLDTHVWIWWHMRPERLSAEAKRRISDPSQYEELLLSAISPWEFCKLLELGRIAISCDPEEWLDRALNMVRLRLVPLTPRISYKSTALPVPLHGDPADQIIVATAREESATVLTADKRIRGYEEVRSLW